MTGPCSKIPYPSARIARADADAIRATQRHFTRRRQRKPVDILTPYECPRCGSWHLTANLGKRHP